MVIFYQLSGSKIYAVESEIALSSFDLEKLNRLFDNAQFLTDSSGIPLQQLVGNFVGPRKEMITPWSTNAVEITQIMGINGIKRLEEFYPVDSDTVQYDAMLKSLYHNLDQQLFVVDMLPEKMLYIDDIAAYSKQEGLALSDDEIGYLEGLAKQLNRNLTDSEVFGFSQVNSEHCRHKIFNGTFVIDGVEMPESLFGLIRKTSNLNPNKIVSAYSDNVAFVEGVEAEQFAPQRQDTADYFKIDTIDTIVSLKAETHNFPTTVEPFNGAATGSGGEIRDRMAGGKGSFPMAGTAVYMTAYPRLENGREWELNTQARKWLYQTPEEILIKASNGASDFGNKFGQPLICGSVLTFEHFEAGKKFAYDKVIMLAGGVGFGKKSDSFKSVPQKGDKIVVLGGDNYRIGMGGGAVSSVATGEYHSSIELNAVQRSNPEMQKRVYNVIRALAELSDNPIISVHDHGAGGHLNALSELIEATGGTIYLSKLPIGDPTLSAREIIGNESQERMGLVVKEKDLPLLQKIASRERAPMYVVGEVTGDMELQFVAKDGTKPIDLQLTHFFGKPPKTVITDNTVSHNFASPKYEIKNFEHYLELVLQLEAVACKDWLTNKVDRSVTGKIAKQQTAGSVQLPLNNVAVVAFDYITCCKAGEHNKKGIATSLGHAPVSGLVNPEAGSILSIAEALTNLVWAPIDDGFAGISLSANWMWPSKNSGEDARLYRAVKAASDFAIALGMNIPTGKDSLSMTQKYDGDVVYSPGTVIISTVGVVTDIRKVIEPVLVNEPDSVLIYLDFSGDGFNLGGSSFAQIVNVLGNDVPMVTDTEYFKTAFATVQQLILADQILAGHDISAGGMITTLLEMCFARNNAGLDINLDAIAETDLIKLLFSEKPGVIIQVADKDAVCKILSDQKLQYAVIGKPTTNSLLNLTKNAHNYQLDVYKLRDIWYKTSYLLDRKQSGEKLALERYNNYKNQALNFIFKDDFMGKSCHYGIDIHRRTPSGIKAAIIREKGVNGDREMAYAMYLAGFDVKDVHVTDLIAGRETLEDIHFIAFVGGFSNSDVLGSAKGWAGAFLYNDKARAILEAFYKRTDTLSLGLCNGCQLVVELGLIYPDHEQQPKMAHNDSHKFESGFYSLDIQPNNSVMLHTLAGERLGAWVAHGEGKFVMPYPETRYHIPAKFTHHQYPGNPNGSDFATAAICSADGRHLAMMPHIERAFLPWQWAYYPEKRKHDEVSPWIEAFVNARNWVLNLSKH